VVVRVRSVEMRQPIQREPTVAMGNLLQSQGLRCITPGVVAVGGLSQQGRVDSVVVETPQQVYRQATPAQTDSAEVVQQAQAAQAVQA